MNTSRLEAFSDGVLAIIITIMVLGIDVPHGADWQALKELTPSLISYLLSFIYVGIYWNNHHHLFNATEKLNGKVLWANLHLLFWLSLLPLITGWLGASKFERNPAILYGAILFLCATAWWILARQIKQIPGNERVAKAIGKDRKTLISMGLYALGIILSCFFPLAGLLFYYGVALVWIIPDMRIEKSEKDISSTK